ncbi:phosphatase PAP2 family protein [Bifidobacterium sp.]|jgi:undecaprenyl-diphosphatase|uniref:phosphatase PAP2 family protein n=1 Tax=Bifidobacterium sp. TaxID=41200 RepID=UPI0025BB4EEA|nr:phosphatase PAP2 family protein [Bifidobacterium sp.]MCH4208696.1 phosphatase PAP2 family protein [Bifidobacterium sp.]MCI1224332.1 phosphatase PAP2 family protein [Bifidobacterium sp.]
MKHLVSRFDTSVTHYIVNLSPSLRPLFLAITALGSPVAAMTIGAVVAGWGYFRANLRLACSGALIWLTLGAGSIIKLIVDRERPHTAYAAHLLFDTNSFPSGHTSGSTIAYGFLAYLAWHLLPRPYNAIAVVLLILLIIFVGISRIYLGAHFPSDVVAGWLLGAASLCVVIFVLRPLA